MTGKERLELFKTIMSELPPDREIPLHTWEACAIHIAACDPRMQKEGLHLRHNIPTYHDPVGNTLRDMATFFEVQDYDLCLVVDANEYCRGFVKRTLKPFPALNTTLIEATTYPRYVIMQIDELIKRQAADKNW